MKINNLSKIFKINDLVNYQEGSIVSKTVLNEDNGTITLFGFDEGQSLSEHTAPFDALLYIIDGKAEIIISGKKYLLNKDEFIIMPKNEPHAVNSINKFKMMLIMIKS